MELLQLHFNKKKKLNVNSFSYERRSPMIDGFCVSQFKSGQLLDLAPAQ